MKFEVERLDFKVTRHIIEPDHVPVSSGTMESDREKTNNKDKVPNDPVKKIRRSLSAVQGGGGGGGGRRVFGGKSYFSVESMVLLVCLTASLLILPVILPPLPPPPLMLLLLPIGMLGVLLTLAFMPSSSFASSSSSPANARDVTYSYL